MAVYNISLADLRHDIAGIVPADVVSRWNQEEKSAERHAHLLEPYLVRGTIVSSDSAGLSTLTQKYSLPQVMKLVSEPKEVIHAYGRAIGGEAIGVWAADNSQMFYPESVAPADVVSQMLAAQRKARRLTVQVGMGIHFCEAYKVGGGLYGHEAELIESIAEDKTRDGEIVVSDVIHATLPTALRDAARQRSDIDARYALWSLADYEGPITAIEGDDVRYPIPFDVRFFSALRATSLAELGEASFAQYQGTHTVVFLKFDLDPGGLLLDTFTQMSLVDLSLRRVASSYDADVVKSNGALGIVLLHNGDEAISFARDVIETTRLLGTKARAGLTWGDVFLFPLQDGNRDIAGHPVNVASKLSEDSGLDGILIDSSVRADRLAQRSEPFRLTLSRVEFTGHRIPA